MPLPMMEPVTSAINNPSPRVPWDCRVVEMTRFSDDEDGVVDSVLMGFFQNGLRIDGEGPTAVVRVSVVY